MMTSKEISLHQVCHASRFSSAQKCWSRSKENTGNMSINRIPTHDINIETNPGQSNKLEWNIWSKTRTAYCKKEHLGIGWWQTYKVPPHTNAVIPVTNSYIRN